MDNSKILEAADKAIILLGNMTDDELLQELENCDEALAHAGIL